MQRKWLIERREQETEEIRTRVGYDGERRGTFKESEGTAMRFECTERT